MTELEHNKSNKYLGTMEANGISYTLNKEKIRKEFSWRIRTILRMELKAKNKVIAVNTLAIPIMTNSLNIIN